jgi:cell division inhibitor SepF
MLALLALGHLSAGFGYSEREDRSSSSSLPRRVSVVNPKSFEEAKELADCFKRQQLVILNLWNVNGELSKRMVDFCAGLTYALGGQVRPIAERLFLLTPYDVQVLNEEGEQLAERVFFNQL